MQICHVLNRPSNFTIMCGTVNLHKRLFIVGYAFFSLERRLLYFLIQFRSKQLTEYVELVHGEQCKFDRTYFEQLQILGNITNTHMRIYMQC